jgi:DNA-binding MarR family transcriptional regulator
MKRIATGPVLPGGGEPALDLEHFVPFRLSVLANRVTRAVARVYARRFQLSAPEWRTLAVLGRYGAMTANSVVERTAMDKVRVSRAVARLLVHGRITRRTDPADRRRAILDVTPEGRAVYTAVVPLVLAVENELLGRLGAEERRLLDVILHKLEQGTAADFGGEEEEEDLSSEPGGG